MTQPADLIIATQSVVRHRLFRAVGLSPICQPANIDEAAIKAALLSDQVPHRDIADALAETKAGKIARRNPNAIVIGADQVLSADTDLLDKPKDQAELRAQLMSLRNWTHQLYSATVAFENARPVWRFIGSARITMRNFSDTALDKYLNQHGDDLLDTVGGYKIEDGGAALFGKVEGDYFSILGIPFLEVLDFLRTRGLAPK
ncbi:Maf family protein [Halovulum sp. GXIMD14793]